MEVSGRLHVPVTLPPETEPQSIVNTRLGGIQRCSGLFGKEKKVLLLREFEP